MIPVLVDTSVWIDYFQDRSTKAVEKLAKILEERQPFGIASLIYQEILQGTDSDFAFHRYEKYLRTQTFYHPLDPLTSYAEAARMYARCRRGGITIRSTIDCLIAQIAIEHGLPLLHSDKDFDQLAKVVPELSIH